MDLDALSSRSLEDLEWPELLELVAGHAVSELGKARVRALTPVADQEQAELRLSVVAEALELHRDGAPLPCRPVDGIAQSVERARRHGVLSGEELAHVLVLVEAALELFRFGKAHVERAELLRRILDLDPELADLAREIARVVDAEGRLKDDASPALRDARREVQSLRRKVQARISELIGRYREALQDGYFAEREGRYVLPVRADAPYRVEGIVLGTSASGSTLYVEPRELGELGHKLRMAEVEVEREEARILAEQSSRLVPHADSLVDAEDMVVRADLIAACARFAVRTQGRVVPFDEPGVFVLVQARHPILAHGERPVVPQDLRIEHGRGLVLSGPNAGGKTVALKTLGLLALLQSSGLPVPAEEGTRIGYFSRIFSDIGDDQSLSQSLSTFSGHVERMRDILEVSEPETLVLVDELMSGTDPNEGAVLAIAFLEELVARGALGVVTTHYEPLKQHAALHEKFENAAVGFDFERMEPTFLVEQGRPGASSALVVATRHGLPKRVTERAESLLPEVDARRRREQLDLEQTRAFMERERKELQFELERQRVLTHKLEVEAEKAREARRSDIARESDELRVGVRQARAELKQLQKRIKDVASPGELREIERSIDAVSSRVALGSEVERAARKVDKSEPAREPLRVGQRVRVAGLGTPAEVLELLGKGQVRVVAGVMKLTVKESDVAPWSGSAPKKETPRNVPVPVSQGAEADARTREAPLKSQDVIVDLRGQRVEEGLSQVDSFLDELLRRQEMGGYVLHGHGTGAMKEAVRQHLRGHDVVLSSRPAERDEGGDAFTVFWLRDGAR